MINIIYIVIALILFFVIFIAIRAINLGMKAKNKNYKMYFSSLAKLHYLFGIERCMSPDVVCMLFDQCEPAKTTKATNIKNHRNLNYHESKCHRRYNMKLQGTRYPGWPCHRTPCLRDFFRQ